MAKRLDLRPKYRVEGFYTKGPHIGTPVVKILRYGGVNVGDTMNHLDEPAPIWVTQVDRKR